MLLDASLVGRRGTRKPTLETFFRISEALGIRPSELMRMIEDAMD